MKQNLTLSKFIYIMKVTFIQTFIVFTCAGIAFANGVNAKDKILSAFTVTGKVTDEKGQGLPGVNITSKGSANGTASDGEGNYVLNVSNGSEILLFSFIGYATQEIPVGTQTIINVTMVPDLKSLNEVVVVGYGSQHRREITGAIGSVTTKDINSVAVTGLDQAMQGRLAGVQVTQNSGEPGGGVSIRIRGVGSINNSSEPLFVIDGVPYDARNTGTGSSPLNNINPNDIERIDVLKDAASAAIYGSRGTNGVVLVTTKRGKAGKITVNLDAYVGSQSVIKKIGLLNGSQFAQLANENLANAGNATNPAWSNPATVPNSDWQSAIFQKATVQSYNVSVSGGGEKSRTAFSVGYFDQGGILVSSGFKRYTARLNSDFDITSRIKIGVTLNGAIQEKQFVVTQEPNRAGFDGALINAVRMQPTSPITTDQNGYFGYKADGTIDPTDKTFYGWNGYAFTSLNANGNFIPKGLNNPVYALKNYLTNPQKSQQLMAATYIDYEIIKGLKFRSTINLILDNAFNTAGIKQAPEAINGVGQFRNSQYNEGWNRGFQWNWINTLTYFKNFGNHNFTLIAGTDALKNTSQFIYAQVANVPDDVQVIANGDLATRTVQGFPGVNDYSLASYIGRLSYDYAGKYLLTANIRRDGSSNFGPQYKYGVFPSVSVGWRISEEAFLKNLTFISDLKLRASYGVVGNQNIPPYLYLSTYSTNGGTFQYVVGGVSLPAYYANNTADKNIRWESSSQNNFGLDASFLNGKFTFTTDYYIKKLYNMLGQVDVPFYTGVNGYAITKNGFSMENSGIEAALGYNEHLGDFKFSLNANFSTLNNKVTDLAGKQYIGQNTQLNDGNNYNDGGSQTRTKVGERIGNFWGYVTDGIAQNAADAAKGVAMGLDVKPGDRLYKDLNGPTADGKGLTGTPDGKVTSEDKTIIGNGLPKYIFGLNVKAEYKGFDFSVFFNGQSGVQIANMTKFYTYHMHNGANGGLNNVSSDLLNSWHGEGTSNTLPRNSYNIPTSNLYFSTFNIENGAFVRIRNLQLGYTIPEAIAKKVAMSRARIYIMAQNLHTFTKYTGFDPEVGSQTQNVLTSGVDFGRYPTPRIFTMGLNVQF